MTCIGTREHIGGNLEHIGHIFGKIVLAPCIGLRVTLGTCIGANTSQKTPIRGIFVTSEARRIWLTSVRSALKRSKTEGACSMKYACCMLDRNMEGFRSPWFGRLLYRGWYPRSGGRCIVGPVCTIRAWIVAVDRRPCSR